MTESVMGPLEPQRIQDRYMAKMIRPIWMIFDKPPERPKDFVVKCFVDRFLPEIAVCGTLPVARSYLPMGVTKREELIEVTREWLPDASARVVCEVWL